MFARAFRAAAPRAFAPAAAAFRPRAQMQMRFHHAFVTQPAPAFKADALMPDGSFKEVSLSDYKGKYVVLFFYPLDWTFVCPTEITAFSDRYAEFQKLGCEVIACSVDSKFSHLAWTKTDRKAGGLGKMNIPILSDLSKSIAESYGTLLDAGIALRGLFIIDKNGVLRQSTINDLPVGRSVDETLRLVEAFQYSDNNEGQVVPCDWKPGSKTMKADPTGSIEYFESSN